MRLQRIVLVMLFILVRTPLARAQSTDTDNDQRNAAVARLIEWRDTIGEWRRANRALFGFYTSYAALETADVHSTRLALGRGGVEANAAMRGLAGHPAAFTLVKMGAAASTIFLRVCSPLVINCCRRDHSRPIGPFSS